MERSPEVGELIAALAKAQAEFTFAAKDSTNPAFNSKYADLAANLIAVRPALSKHGIAVLQFDESDVERQTASVTTSLHFANQWISCTAEAPATGQKGFNVQSLGACWTYLRRYTLQALCGLASDDDDGNSLAVENKPVAKKIAAEVERQKAGKIPAVSPQEETDWKNAVDTCKSAGDVAILVKLAKEREYPEPMRRLLATKANSLDLAWNGHTSMFEPKNTEAK